MNQHKVVWSIFWFFGSIVAYTLMEKYHQGLNLHSSKEMFLFSCCETFFMVSMAMSYFFSWQTYSLNTGINDAKVMEVVPVSFREVLWHTRDSSQRFWSSIYYDFLKIKHRGTSPPGYQYSKFDPDEKRDFNFEDDDDEIEIVNKEYGNAIRELEFEL